jgi:argininosuccinate lyase
MRAFAPEFTGDIARLLDPKQGMQSREVKGGTGPNAVSAALAAARERLAQMRA